MRCPKCGNSRPHDFSVCKPESARTLPKETEGRSTATASAAVWTDSEEWSEVDVTSPHCKCGADISRRDQNGSCGECGGIWHHRDADHFEEEASSRLAAVTDRGIKHESNEDAFAIRQLAKDGTNYYVLAVCDGLSSAESACCASFAAANAAVNYLVQSIKTAEPAPSKCMVKAIETAHAAICDLNINPQGMKDAPGSTIVCAVAWPGHAVIGWAGDSRAYLVSSSGAQLLTHDHSWVNEVVDIGLMTEAQAMRSGNTHVITKCIGPTENPDRTLAPEVPVIEVDLPSRCRLVLCSDGLWNYAALPAELADLMSDAPPDGNALAQAKNLVDVAIEMGGHDNITVAICEL